MKFRKKPIAIDAWKWIGNFEEFPLWIGVAHLDGTIEMVGDRFTIKTLEGVMEADVGDWIIKGVAGELYPCKPHIFESTYERVGG